MIWSPEALEDIKSIFDLKRQKGYKMPVATLKKVTEKFGISLQDQVKFTIRGNTGIMEVKLNASDQEIELSSANDIGEDFLSEEELTYYLSLEENNRFLAMSVFQLLPIA